MNDPGSEIPIVFNNCISIKSAYNVQSQRRLLRDGWLSGVKLGQAWRIEKSDFEAYFLRAAESTDRRFGPPRLNN